jgi:hypothetical protein
VLALAHWHTPRGKWWPIEVSTRDLSVVVVLLDTSDMLIPLYWLMQINRVSMKVAGGSKKKATTGPVAVSMTITSLPGVRCRLD